LSVRPHSQDDARSVLAVHSFGLDPGGWTPLIFELATERTVLRPALPLHPGGGRGRLGPDVLRSFAQELSDDMDALELSNIHVVGHSMGGVIAGILTALRPHRVRSLTLVSTPPRGAEIFTERANTARNGDLTRLRQETIERWFGASATPNAKVAIEYAEKCLAQVSQQAWESYWDSLALFEGFDSLDLGTVPVLCVSGASDLSTPPAAIRTLVELIPGSEYTELDHVGHMAPLENPRGLAEVLENFWSSVDESESGKTNK
jgi:pimeloyl-ACP methyl ester carboxylesterase